MAAWPASLPCAQLAGYTLAPHNQVLRTEMDSGAPRVRVINRARRDTITLSWVLSVAQYREFRDWYESSTGAAWGAAWFTITLPAGGPNFTNVREARFVGPWSATLMRSAGHHHLISASLETR